MRDFLVTGGAGFIGANLCMRLLEGGASLRILDDLSRPGSERNLRVIADTYPGRFTFHPVTLGYGADLAAAVRGADRIYHLAGQVAVTSSVQDPFADFEANAIGTFRLLDAARMYAPEAAFLYASTNKVYGELTWLGITETPTRYELRDMPYGVSESTPLDFHSPYGCSKGAADQYVRDYARIYGMRTVVMRQSCIYGPRQLGHSDQGWLAWFTECTLRRQPLIICGDGRQVRDVLFIDDLLDAYEAALSEIDHVAGEVFNVGGGPRNSVSVWAELEPLLREVVGWTSDVTYCAWRPGDQKVFISDIRRIEARLGWKPHVSVRAGLERLVAALRESGSRAAAGH